MIDKLLQNLGFYKRNIPQCNNIICNIKNYINALDLEKRSKLEKKTIYLIKKILDKILEDKYNTNIRRFEKKWGKIEVLEINNLFNGSKEIAETNYNKLLNDSDRKNYEKELYLALQLDEHQKRRDINILFSILNKYYLLLDL